MTLKSGTKEYQAEASRRSYLKRKEQVKARAKEWNSRQRLVLREIINLHKQRGCTDCGGHFHTEAMEFDHIGVDKTFEISTAVSQGRVSVATLEAELEKCEVVCANCHRVRTYERRTVNVSTQSIDGDALAL